MGVAADVEGTLGRKLQFKYETCRIDDRSVESIVSPGAAPEVDELGDLEAPLAQLGYRRLHVRAVALLGQLNREAHTVLGVLEEGDQVGLSHLPLKCEGACQGRCQLVGVFQSDKLRGLAFRNVGERADDVFHYYRQTRCDTFRFFNRSFDSPPMFQCQRCETPFLGFTWIEVFGGQFGRKLAGYVMRDDRWGFGWRLGISVVRISIGSLRSRLICLLRACFSSFPRVGSAELRAQT